MSTTTPCPGTCASCFYCDRPLVGRHEHDHYPIPVRVGGVETVPTCLGCHDLKDRIPLANWPAQVLDQAMGEAGPLGRVLLAKLVALTHDAAATSDAA